MDVRPVVVITGATSGLGRVAALELARCGARLGIVARDGRRAAALKEEVGQVAAGTPVDVFAADLSSLKETHRAGQQISAYYDRIDVLVNNAGIHAFSQRVTAEGFAEMTAVNYLAPWVLTSALRGKLIASAPARIVNVASQAARQAGGATPARDDLTGTDAYTRRESGRLYGRSKLLAIMFTQELARQLASDGVTVNCCCPGFNTTGLGRELPFAGPLEKILTGLRIGDPRRGARIITQLARDPGFAAATGGFFSANGAKPLACPEPGRGEAAQRRLWDHTAELVGSLGIPAA